jgi:methylated-DNA-[protein]-cysteine S-methyltransferase
MSSIGCHVVSTTLGPFALQWSEAGLVSAHLARSTASGEPPAWLLALATRLEGHLQGRLDAFADVPLDLSGCPPFHARVYAELRRVGPGHTVTYGELAQRLGSPGAARAVGQAVANNPWLLVVPCHRVLAAGGRLGGFSAPGGVATKRRLLSIEGLG